MKILDKYFGRQFLGAFVGFSLVLSGLAWMVQILLLIKLIIKYGIDIGGFLAMSAYTVPFLVATIIPFVVFIASIFVYNRLIENNEVTVCLSAGQSGFKIARPVIISAVIITAIHFVLNLWVVPVSQNEFYKSQWELRYGLGHLKLKESAFSQLTDGVVIYVDQANQKDLDGVTIRDGRSAGEEKYIASKNGKLVNTPNGLSIVMGSGGLQINRKNGVLIGTFDGAQMDLGMEASAEFQTSRVGRVPTSELLDMLKKIETYPAKVMQKIATEAGIRFLSPMLNLLFALIAMVFLLKTNILRRRVSFSVLGAAIAMIAVEAAFMSTASAITTVNGLLYLAAGLIILDIGLLWRLAK